MHTKLRQLEDLFAHRGDAHVLLTLSGSPPLRFSELSQRMYERSTIRITDNTIARALCRLENDALVACDNTDRRHPTYQLTTRGLDRAALISELISTLERHGRAELQDVADSRHGPSGRE